MNAIGQLGYLIEKWADVSPSTSEIPYPESHCSASKSPICANRGYQDPSFVKIFAAMQQKVFSCLGHVGKGLNVLLRDTHMCNMVVGKADD